MKLSLNKDEVIIKTISKSLFAYIGFILFFVLHISIITILYIYFKDFTFILFVLFVYCCYVFLGGINLFLDNFLDKFLITNQRVIVIDRNKFYSKKIININYEEIKDIKFERNSWFESIFNYGDLKIESQNSTFLIDFIKNGEQYLNIIKKTI